MSARSLENVDWMKEQVGIYYICFGGANRSWPECLKKTIHCATKTFWSNLPGFGTVEYRTELPIRVTLSSQSVKLTGCAE